MSPKNIVGIFILFAGVSLGLTAAPASAAGGGYERWMWEGPRHSRLLTTFWTDEQGVTRVVEAYYESFNKDKEGRWWWCDAPEKFDTIGSQEIMFFSQQ